MRILLDHCVNQLFREYLLGHEVSTAYELGWQTLQNGKLLNAAEAHGFALLITVDRGLRFQQNFAKRNLSLVVLEADGVDIESIRALAPSVLEKLSSPLNPGTVIVVRRSDFE